MHDSLGFVYIASAAVLAMLACLSHDDNRPTLCKVAAILAIGSLFIGLGLIAEPIINAFIKL